MSANALSTIEDCSNGWTFPPEPDEKGEFSSPAAGAKFMQSLGLLITPLRGKVPFLTGWQKNASGDPDQIDTWLREYGADLNFGCVARPVEGGIFIFEVDTNKIEGSLNVAQRYKRDTGKDFTPTLTIQSSKNRGHRYYKVTDAVRALGNVGQNAVPFEDFSVRVNGEQAVCPGSFHPTSKLQYKIIKNLPIVEPDSEMIAWFAEQKKTGPKGVLTQLPSAPSAAKPAYVAPAPGEKIFQNRNIACHEWAVRHWLFDESVYHDPARFAADVHAFDVEHCVPPLGDELDRTVIPSVLRKYPKQNKDEQRAFRMGGTSSTLPADAIVPDNYKTMAPTVESANEEASQIPPFDPSVMRDGSIYKQFVDAVTTGTTLAPQFTYAIAKTTIGLMIAGKMRFETVDIEPRIFLALVGETGSGKGEAFRRVLQILSKMLHPRLKIIESADSGAGLKDAFFDTSLPILCFVDEVVDLGHKSKETKNPEIVDTMITLANSTRISRTLAKRNGQSQSRDKNDARLAVVMCGQDGETYAQAFAGRNVVGWWDRTTPEFGTPVVAGDLPPVSGEKAGVVIERLNRMDFDGQMIMTPEADTVLKSFWELQSDDVRKKARFRANLFVDAYLEAYGMGSRSVRGEDAEVAIKNFTRQMTIRGVCFKKQVKDDISKYIGRLKDVAEKMRQQLAAGVDYTIVSKTKRDFIITTNVYRANDEFVFEKAWNVFAKTYLASITVEARGRKYEKFLPLDWAD